MVLTIWIIWGGFKTLYAKLDSRSIKSKSPEWDPSISIVWSSPGGLKVGNLWPRFLDAFPACLGLQQLGR